MKNIKKTKTRCQNTKKIHRYTKLQGIRRYLAAQVNYRAKYRP